MSLRSHHRSRVQLSTIHSFLVGAAALITACTEVPSAPKPASATAVATAVAKTPPGNSLNAKACQKNGWQGLVTSTGTTFTSETACVSYAAQGGTLYRAQTIAFGPLAEKRFGDDPFTVSATATSGLPVTFSASGNCTVSGSTVTLTGQGSCTITARQSGDATWYAAPDVSQSFLIRELCVRSEGSLRVAAATGGTYSFCSAGATVLLTNGQVTVGTALTLFAIGSGNAVIDAQSLSRVFVVTSGGALTLNNVTVTKGRVLGSGGGIYTEGSVTLNGSSAVTASEAWSGAGVFVQAAQSGKASLTMNNTSSVSDNIASGLGSSEFTSGGGVQLFERGAVLVMNGTSSIRNNRIAAGGQAAFGAGLHMAAASATLNGSASITGNVAGGGTTAGPLSRGGGVYFVNAGTLTLSATASISGNSAADAGGGIFRIDGNSGTITGVTATNVVNNTPQNCAGTVAVPGCSN